MTSDPPPPSGTPPSGPPPPGSGDPLREYLERLKVFLRVAWEQTREFSIRVWNVIVLWSSRVWLQIRIWSARAWEATQYWSARAWARSRLIAIAIAAAVAAAIASMRARWQGRSQQRSQQRADRPAPERRRRSERRSQPTMPSSSVIVARPEDDVASVTGKIDTAEFIDVVLVVPRAARRLRQPSAWAHLAAHARRRGMVLRVVSPRRDVRAHARANGLRAVSRLRQLQRTGLQVTIGGHTLRAPRIRFGGIFRLVAIVAVVGALALLVLYRVPSATITIVPEAEEFTTSREVRVSPVADSSDIEQNMIRAVSIRETVTTLITTATTGEAEVGEAVASVTLVFSNTSDEDVDVPAGTEVSDDEEVVTFVTDQSVVVAAGSTVEVAARSSIAGSLGNVEAGVLVVVDGFPDDVTVSNPTAASGGSDELVPAVSEEDVARVSAIADDVLREIAERSLANLLDEGVSFFPETLSTAIFSSVPLQQLDEPAEVLLVEYTIVVSAFGLSPTVTSAFGAAMIREELPEGFELLPGTATVSAVGDIRTEAGQMFVTLEASGMIADVTAARDLAPELTGLQPAEASAIIEERLELLGPPDITISPTIIPWRWLPRSADRIEVVLAGPDFFDEDEDEEDEEDEEVIEGEGELLEPLLPTVEPDGD